MTIDRKIDPPKQVQPISRDRALKISAKKIYHQTSERLTHSLFSHFCVEMAEVGVRHVNAPTFRTSHYRRNCGQRDRDDDTLRRVRVVRENAKRALVESTC